jgi:hypothetical protein
VQWRLIGGGRCGTGDKTSCQPQARGHHNCRTFDDPHDAPKSPSPDARDAIGSSTIVDLHFVAGFTRERLSG